MPLNTSDKVMTNIVVCGTLGFICLTLSVFISPLFYILFVLFVLIVGLSSWKIINREKTDLDTIKGKENNEPVGS